MDNNRAHLRKVSNLLVPWESYQNTPKTLNKLHREKCLPTEEVCVPILIHWPRNEWLLPVWTCLEYKHTCVIHLNCLYYHDKYDHAYKSKVSVCLSVCLCVCVCVRLSLIAYDAQQPGLDEAGGWVVGPVVELGDLFILPGFIAVREERRPLGVQSTDGLENSITISSFYW